VTPREALQKRGYTDREAGFVVLAALQSGYFLRRQFNDYLGRECGAVAQAFIERCLCLGDATETTHVGGRKFYQFTSSSVFSRIGDPNNRNRREHKHETVRRRLMALDYCIGHREAEYVLTEKEKVEFFVERGLPLSDLPSEVFGGSARRYFVDRQPVRRDLQLVFIDEGFSTLSSWSIFLSKHRPIIQRLGDAVTVFATPDEERFRAAEKTFHQVITGTADDGSLDMPRLREYFESRLRFEERDFSSFTQARLDRLREDRRVFSTPEVESLFSEWKRVGGKALNGLKGRSSRLKLALLKHRYDWLSPVRREMSKCR
jgi:hypothetical protein